VSQRYWHGGKWDLGDLEGALQVAKKAWDLCQSRGLESDLPIAGLELSALSISKGEIDVGRDLLNKSLEAAAERSNVVLEAQILVNLAGLREVSGDRKGALETNTRALQKAQMGKTLYVQARALGEIGRMWLAAGVIKDARTSLSAALDIDKANHGSGSHAVRSGVSSQRRAHRRLPQSVGDGLQNGGRPGEVVS